MAKSLFDAKFFDKKLAKPDFKVEKIDIGAIEDRYDKKYNGFCLAVSKYDKDKVNDLMNRKAVELKLAQEELKSTDDKAERVELKVKIDYLKNVIRKCKARANKFKDNK